MAIDIISDTQLVSAQFIYTKILSPTFQLFAILANVINILIFKKIGFGDSINVVFLAISVSDILYVTLDAICSICLLISVSPWQRDIPFSVGSLSGLINICQFVFLDTSTFLEAYLAIARCFCVTLPLRFKNVFTFHKSVTLIIILFLYNLISRIPLLSSYLFVWQTNPLTNITRLTFYSTDTYLLFKAVDQIMDRTVCPVILLPVATACCIVLTTSLKKASIKRKLMTSAHVQNIQNLVFDKVIPNKLTPPYQKGDASGSLSTKEVQLIKAVTLVTILLGAVLLILSVFYLTQAAVPEFFPAKQYRCSYGVTVISINLFIVFHAGVKIIIYYKFNTRFRQELKENLLNVFTALQILLNC